MAHGPGGRQARLGAPPETGELDAAERMSADELRSLQTERLRRTLRHAYANVPFYRKKFDAAGVRVDVSVADPGTIERSAGKMRRVIDQRDA
jgi:phenylacetate-coenzyme A ligase PaaK-like adenylate-forming protein